MYRIKGGTYLTLQEYRQKSGYSDDRAILKCIHDGRLEAIKVFDRWLIRSDAIVSDARYKSGKYINWRLRYEQPEYDDD